MPDAMQKIRKDLGKDAVILNSKIIYTGGFFGLFRKKNIEVIAAVDQEKYKTAEKKSSERNYSLTLNQPANNILFSSKVGQNQESQKNEETILKEIHELKQLISEKKLKDFSNSDYIPAPYQEIYDNLNRQNINKEILRRITEEIYENYYGNKEMVNKETAKDFVSDTLKRYIQSLDFGTSMIQKKYITVIGPTGVGKTTTLAKIASKVAIEQKKKIAFITTDTYRIAAVEQLKIYAKILNVPIEVCYSFTDFQQAIEKFSMYDHVFIDTAGRNFRNEKYVKDLQETIDFNGSMETYLVFSLTAKERDLELIYNQFSKIPIDKFIFTKLDETSQFGSLINLPIKYQKPIAFITTGQDVPDDIIVATHDFVINQIVGETHYE